MSLSFRKYLSNLFGKEERSDCVIKFSLGASCGTSDTCESFSAGDEVDQKPAQPEENDDAADRPTARPRPDSAPYIQLGDPLPAHLLVLCGGSHRFSAAIERWAPIDDPSRKSLLRVPLDSADDLPYALSALRFMYTDALDVNTVETLLRVRRMADYLQIDGCVEACDAAVADLVAAAAAGASSPSQQSSSSTTATGAAASGTAALSAVAALYTHRGLLADSSDGRGSLAKVLYSCRQQLVLHSGAMAEVESRRFSLAGAGDPSLGELLAWAFGDAPSLMSQPDMRQQMEALPLNAMEALLRSDSFATDDESSVLLVVAHWLRAYEMKTHYVQDARPRLCKLVRLSQLSSMYLHALLPALPWFPISPEEYRFLSDFAHAPRPQRSLMMIAAAGLFDCSTAWYEPTVRQAPSKHALRSFNWFIIESDLRSALSRDAASQRVTVYGKFLESDAEQVVACGLEWRPYIQYDKGRDAAGVFLACSWPEALRMQNPAKVVAFARLHQVRLSVFSGESRQQQEAWHMEYDAGSYVRVGWQLGDAEALPLRVAAAVEAQAESPAQNAAGSGGEVAAVPSLLAPWGPYFFIGRLRGSLQLP